jgi:hypothetical protein
MKVDLLHGVTQKKLPNLFWVIDVYHVSMIEK